MDFLNVDGRQAENKLLVMVEAIVETEKPHAKAVPVFWLRGNLDGCDEAIGFVVRWVYTERGTPRMRIGLTDTQDPETERPINTQVFEVFGLGPMNPFVFDLDGVEEFAFVGWSLQWLSDEERKEVEEAQAA